MFKRRKLNLQESVESEVRVDDSQKIEEMPEINSELVDRPLAGSYYSLGLRSQFDEELEEGKDKKHMHPPFVRGCVAAVTRKKPDVSRAFAICQSTYKKGEKKKMDGKMVKRDDWSAKEKQYEKALATARKTSKAKKDK